MNKIEWFYWKSCYYLGVEKINKFSPRYLMALGKFLWLSRNDKWKEDK